MHNLRIEGFHRMTDKHVSFENLNQIIKRQISSKANIHKRLNSVVCVCVCLFVVYMTMKRK